MSHWDEYQLAYGVERFDLSRHQPHPPGYYLFLVLGRLVRPLVADAALALRLVSAGAAACTAAIVVWGLPGGLCRAARASFALAAVALVLASPLFYRYGVVGLSYSAEAACWLALAFALTRRPRGARLWLLFFGIGLSGGLRQTLVVWATLLALWQGLRQPGWVPLRRLPGLALAWAAGLATWGVPLLVEAGGWQAYAAASRHLLGGYIWQRSVLSSGVEALRERVPEMASDLWLGAGLLLVPAALLLALRLGRRAAEALRGIDALLLAACIPAGFYALLIYDSQGYILASLAPIAAWTLLGAARLLVARAPRQQIAGGLSLLAMLTVTPLLPTSRVDGRLVHAALPAEGRRLEMRVAALRDRFDPATTLLVTGYVYWTWGLRHVGHALPEFVTLQLESDPYFAIVGPGKPYLVERGRELEAVGPASFEVTKLLPSLGGRELVVVYASLWDASDLIDPSCAPLLRGLQVGRGEHFGVILPGQAYEVWVHAQRLTCRMKPGR